MIFEEHKKNKKYLYIVKEVFGILEIKSKDKLDAEMLDSIFVAIWNIVNKSSNKIIKGDVKGKNIQYKITKKSLWSKKGEKFKLNIKNK